MMSEKPILFNGEMVRAILDGRKRVTRRVIKFKDYRFPGDNPHNNPDTVAHLDGGGNWVFWSGGDGPGLAEFTKKAYPNGEGVICPYGRPGDLLWVREAWKPGAWREDGRIAIDYRATPEITNTPWVEIPEDYTGKQFDELWLEWTDELLAAGSVPTDGGYHYWEPGESPLKWRPSIFMPRWASRLTLRVTAVRVERVQDIKLDQVVKEGVGIIPDSFGFVDSKAMFRRFAGLWDSINAKRGYSFESDPWVWVVEFEPYQPGS